MTNTKTITFLDKEYEVPTWVSWVGRERDGSIIGYQYEPFEVATGYEEYVGQSCTIYSPMCEPVLRRV
jgi:hypothetical protein